MILIPINKSRSTTRYMNEIEQKNIVWSLILIMAILPVFRWVQISPLQYRFLDFSATMASIGQITALLGMMLFSISLILSGKFMVLDRYLHGLDNVYSKHHILGAISFSLLLFHPLFLAFRFLPISTKDAALFLLPGASQSINYGIVSLFLLIILIALTFFVCLAYHRWKMSHTLMIVVAFFAILHSITTASDISRDPFLRTYILGFSFLGFSASFHQAFLSRYIRKKYIYIVKKISQVGSGTVEIEMSPKNDRLNFNAGQFIFISFSSKSISPETHPFSISSSENDPNLRISIKSLGDFTRNISYTEIGTEVRIEGPYGKFSRNNSKSKDQIWIAGGIGITPMLSMARSLRNNSSRIDLYYGVKNKQEAAFLDELLGISKSHPNFKVIGWFSDEKGHLNGNAIFEMSENLANKDIFLCGPAPFMQSIRAQLIDLGISESRIHWELFNLST